MNTLTIEQKTALARLLPEEIIYRPDMGFHFQFPDTGAYGFVKRIDDYHWDNVVNRIKAGMPESEQTAYFITLLKIQRAEGKRKSKFTDFATLSEQADAIIAVKSK